MARTLWTIVISKALQSDFPVVGAEIGVEDDPEEETSTPVLRIRTLANAAQTLAFWDSLDADLSRWMARISPRDRETVLNHLGLRFFWADGV